MRMVFQVSVVLLALLSATACSRSTVIAELSVVLVNNLVIVPTSINDSEPLSFILDTGASTSVIDRTRAQQLGLKLGTADDATTGGGTIEAAAISGARLSVGGAQIDDAPLVAIDLAGLQAGLGYKVDGIIGYDLFQRHVVEIDYIARVVRLHDGARWNYSGNGDVMPITLEDQIPFARIGVVPIAGAAAEAKVELDTGQTGALTLTRPYVDAQRLLAASQPTLSIRTGAILAGGVSAQVARLGGVQVGKSLIKNPLVNITPGQIDAGVASTTAGLLGAEILRRFHVIVDYPRQRVILEPNADFDAPMEFDMSGMSLAAMVTEPPAYRVRTVIEGSPAAEAGIAVNDVVTAIDGRPAAQMTLTEIRQLFRVPDRAYPLTLARDGASRQVTIRTRRLM